MTWGVTQSTLQWQRSLHQGPRLLMVMGMRYCSWFVHSWISCSIIILFCESCCLVDLKIFIFSLSLFVLCSKFCKRLKGRWSWPAVLCVGPYGLCIADFRDLVFMYEIEWFCYCRNNFLDSKRLLGSVQPLRWYSLIFACSWFESTRETR